MLLDSHIWAFATCFAGKVCGPVRSTWGISLGEDKLGARAWIHNTKIARRANIPHSTSFQRPIFANYAVIFLPTMRTSRRQWLRSHMGPSGDPRSPGLGGRVGALDGGWQGGPLRGWMGGFSKVGGWVRFHPHTPPHPPSQKKKPCLSVLPPLLVGLIRTWLSVKVLTVQSHPVPTTEQAMQPKRDPEKS